MTLVLQTATGIAEQWLALVLKGDSTLSGLVGGRIYSTIAPQGATYPLLIFRNLSGQDVRAIGPRITMSRVTYALAAYSDTPTIVALDAIMARAQVILQGGANTMPGGYQLGCTRMMPPSVLGVPDAGINYRQMVATYRLDIREGLEP